MGEAVAGQDGYWETATGIYVRNNPVNFIDPWGLCAKGQGEDRNFWGEYYDYMNWVWDIYTPGKVPEGLSKNAYGYAQEGWQAHVDWHKELRRSVSEGGPYGQGGPYVALAGVETVGLGGLLTTGGFTAIAEGGAAATIAGGGWVVIGAEIIWIGVDIIGGYRDSLQNNKEQNGYNK